MSTAVRNDPGVARQSTRARSGAGYHAGLDGLRALAVGAVIAYDAGIPGARGGFLGVEVFFVPTTDYVITVACYAAPGRPDGGALRSCDSIAATVGMRSGASFPVGPQRRSLWAAEPGRGRHPFPHS